MRHTMDRFTLTDGFPPEDRLTAEEWRIRCEDCEAQGHHDGHREGLFKGLYEGKLEGLRAAVRVVLEARGIDMTERAEDRLLECTDERILDRWLRRALTADSVREVIRRRRSPGFGSSQS